MLMIGSGEFDNNKVSALQFFRLQRVRLWLTGRLVSAFQTLGYCTTINQQSIVCFHNAPKLVKYWACSWHHGHSLQHWCDYALQALLAFCWDTGQASWQVTTFTILAKTPELVDEQQTSTEADMATMTPTKPTQQVNIWSATLKCLHHHSGRGHLWNKNKIQWQCVWTKHQGSIIISCSKSNTANWVYLLSLRCYSIGGCCGMRSLYSVILMLVPMSISG
jgi:hypothetical protein